VEDFQVDAGNDAFSGSVKVTERLLKTEEIVELDEIDPLLLREPLLPSAEEFRRP
jgi:hypothetical protein